MKRCGMSVLYTSTTDTLAFALGAASSIPAVSYFCSYAAMSVFVDFILQVSVRLRARAKVRVMIRIIVRVRVRAQMKMVVRVSVRISMRVRVKPTLRVFVFTK